jgi:hypothetical protein
LRTAARNFSTESSGVVSELTRELHYGATSFFDLFSCTPHKATAETRNGFETSPFQHNYIMLRFDNASIVQTRGDLHRHNSIERSKAHFQPLFLKILVNPALG